MIDAWVRLWDEREAPTSLAMVRLLLGLALLVDLLQIVQLGLVDALFTGPSAGGLVAGRTDAPWALGVGLDPWSGRLLYGAMLLSALCLCVGWWTRLSAVTLLLLWAQFAWMVPQADRGIDMLARNVLLLLAFSGAGAALSVDAWWAQRRGRPATASIPAWPRRLLLLQLVAMYAGAGVQKYAQQWWPWGDFAALWVIWHDWPMSAVAADGWLTSGLAWRFSQLATAVTITWEVTFPLMLWWWWLLRTQERGGRLRAWVVRWRPDLVYVGLGVVFHLGIAWWLDLGIFPWAMLALYPAFVAPGDWSSWISSMWYRNRGEGGPTDG